MCVCMCVCVCVSVCVCVYACVEMCVCGSACVRKIGRSATDLVNGTCLNCSLARKIN